MTRWLALLSAVVLSAGALQVRAQHTPTTGEGPSCNDGPGQLCRIQTTERCEKWVQTTGGGGMSPTPSITLKYECERWVTNEKRYYYAS